MSDRLTRLRATYAGRLVLLRNDVRGAAVRRGVGIGFAAGFVAGAVFAALCLA